MRQIKLMASKLHEKKILRIDKKAAFCKLLTPAFFSIIAFISPLLVPDSPNKSEFRLYNRHLTQNFIAALLLMVCAAFGSYYAYGATVPLIDDTIHHFLRSRWMLQHIILAVDVWGRPAVTLAYFPAAQYGFIWCRLTSLAICLGASWYAFLLAKDLRLKYAWLVIPLVFFQPYFFKLSTDLLTEPLFSLFIICGVRNYIRQNYSFAALQFSASAAARPEGFFFIAFFGITLLVETRRGNLGTGQQAFVKLLTTGALLAAVPLIWSITGGYISSTFGPDTSFNPLWLKDQNPWDTNRFKYGSDGILHYLFLMRQIVGLVAFPLMILGLGVCFRRERLWILPGLAIYFLALHTAFRVSGYFASSGEPRYFAAIAPIMGIMAIVGLDRFVGSIRWVVFTFLATTAVYKGVFPWLRELPIINETNCQVPGSTVSEAISRHPAELVQFYIIGVILTAWLIFGRCFVGEIEEKTIVRRLLIGILIIGCLLHPGIECLNTVKPARESISYSVVTEFGNWFKGNYPTLHRDLNPGHPRQMQGKLVLSRVSLHMQEGWDPYDDSRFDNLRLSDLNTMPWRPGGRMGF